jgi:hypothetical protein
MGGLMTKNIVKAVAAFYILCLSVADAAPPDHMYLCRSPILAYDFYNSLIDLVQKGIHLTPTIAEQVCAGMVAGPGVPQCIRVKAGKFMPIASGWGGELAMTDGTTKIWFHKPDGYGWIDSRMYVQYVNAMQKKP